MNLLLVVPDDISESPRISAGYQSIYRRIDSLNLSTYYQSVLEWMTHEKNERSPAGVVILEKGYPLVRQEKYCSVYAAEDLMGLMMQSSCRTLNEEGHHQFTDVSCLFDIAWRERFEKCLAQEGLLCKRAVVAAVAAPEMLTDFERQVLRNLDADVAAMHLLLDARAARARAIPALGVLLPEPLIQEAARILALAAETIYD